MPVHQPPPVIIEAARNERKRLAEEREATDKKIAELDAYLRAFGVGSIRGPKEDPNSLAGQIKAMARKMIVPGAYVTTREILEALVAERAVFPETGKPPIERVGNVLWKMGLYTGDKTRGWSLKSDHPKIDPPVQGEIDEEL